VGNWNVAQLTTPVPQFICRVIVNGNSFQLHLFAVSEHAQHTACQRDNYVSIHYKVQLSLLLLLLLHPFNGHLFNGLFSRTTWVGQQHKDKPFWILLEQEMMGVSVASVGPYANHLHHTSNR